ncbi:hypothetical protein [Psychrobacter sp. I-STPA6b]|uniref:hypothetical protein n=1 Tax=Psychrobacter sp. I-STPA6b TaxID=2585718 RepID=UPI001D0CA370|nr:hypothetical protein [Psychrobacter sp. I-STPA6b]
MKSFTRKNTWSKDSHHGWGSGYVAIPESSSWHGVEYEQIPVSVHGGLTWSSLAKDLCEIDGVDDDDWIIGFDTQHSGDNLIDQDEAYVLDETQSLLRQMRVLDISHFVNTRLVVVCPVCDAVNDVSSMRGYYPETKNWDCKHCGNIFYFIA